MSFMKVPFQKHEREGREHYIRRNRAAEFEAGGGGLPKFDKRHITILRNLLIIFAIVGIHHVSRMADRVGPAAVQGEAHLCRQQIGAFDIFGIMATRRRICVISILCYR